MELIGILLLSCVFFSFEGSVSGEEKFEIKIFRSITKIPNNNGKIPYLKEHPEADTDQLTEERRLQLCRTGFDHVLKHKKGKNFQFTGDKKLEKLDAYVFVNLSSDEDGWSSSSESDDSYYSESDSTSSSGDESDEDVEVRPAYQCPTTPPIYIHVDCDWVDEKPIWVIFKDGGKPFNVKNINEYRFVFPDDIREATAKEIEDTAEENIAHTAFDDDELPEEQRLKMCKKVVNMAPEIGAYSPNDFKIRTSKYYVLSGDEEKEMEMEMKLDMDWETDSNENPTLNVKNSASRTNARDTQNTIGDTATKTAQDPKSESTTDAATETAQDPGSESTTDAGITSGNSEDSDSSTEDNLTIMKAFACSTVPEIYINVTRMDKSDITLWALVKKSEIKQPPAFGITGYELIVANSIHKIYKKNDNPDKKWQEDNLPRPKNISELIKSFNVDQFRGDDDDDLSASIQKLEKVGQILDTIMEKIGKKDAVIDFDELKEEDRLSICHKAMKTVFGENVKFIKGNTGRSQYYRVYENKVHKSKDRSENSIRPRRYESEEVVKAFSCPTRPLAYIRIATQLTENIGQVIVSVRDLAHEFIQYK